MRLASAYDLQLREVSNKDLLAQSLLITTKKTISQAKVAEMMQLRPPYHHPPAHTIQARHTTSLPATVLDSYHTRRIKQYTQTLK